MKIIILGAGRVGTSVAENLASEKNDITVIDTDPTALVGLQDRFDLRTLPGNGIHPSILREAGIEDADLFIAAAARDETNLVATRIARQIFNVPTCIARLRSPEFIDNPRLIEPGPEGFGVDYAICPEQSVTTALMRLVEYPEALQVLEFADAKVSLIAVRAYAGGPLVSHPIADLRKHMPNVAVRVVAIYRDDRAVLPGGTTMIEPGDEVFCLAATKDIRQVLAELRRMDKPVRRIMIAGGGNIGLRLARQLENDRRARYTVKIIDPSKRRCEYLASQLSSDSLILNGDSTDEGLLAHEHVEEMDLFISLTNDDESNIMAALLAKRMGARRVIALINRRAYGELVQGGQIDIAISPSHATIGELLAYVRRGDVVAVHSLRRGAAEAIEAVAHGDARSSRVVGKRIEDIDLLSGKTPGAMIGAVVRGSGDEAKVMMAHHDIVIESGDHVIVFVSNKRLIPKVERLFQVDAKFF